MLRKKKGEINGHLRIKKDNKIIKVKKKKKTHSFSWFPSIKFFIFYILFLASITL